VYSDHPRRASATEDGGEQVEGNTGSAGVINADSIYTDVDHATQLRSQ